MDSKVQIGSVEFRLDTPIKVVVHTYNDHLTISNKELPPGPYMGELITPESNATSDDPRHWFVRLPTYVEIPYTKLVEELSKNPGLHKLVVQGKTIDLTKCEAPSNV